MQLVYIQNVANPLSSISLNTQEKMQKWTQQFIIIIFFFLGGGKVAGGKQLALWSMWKGE